MQHLSEAVRAGKIDSVILSGDLSYADGYAPAWDEYGRLSEFLHGSVATAYAAGNHEVANGMENFGNFIPRYGWPSSQGQWSGSSLWYSFESGMAHVITMCSYCDYSVGSAQYQWLLMDLGRIDRSKTPWLIVSMHVPFYSSNIHHGSGESDEMKASMEKILYAHKVDLIVSGHVHAYERTGPVMQYKEVCDGPVQIVVGDGGNKEGPACPWSNSTPAWSRFREFSFGHGQISIVNSTHAHWQWHRNQDGSAVQADAAWLQTASTRCQAGDHAEAEVVV
jgi:3',5'-cyclic AMP phosphodiesterase CpdA